MFAGRLRAAPQKDRRGEGSRFGHQNSANHGEPYYCAIYPAVEPTFHQGRRAFAAGHGTKAHAFNG